jgi:hypothetical protein
MEVFSLANPLSWIRVETDVYSQKTCIIDLKCEMPSINLCTLSQCAVPGAYLEILQQILKVLVNK